MTELLAIIGSIVAAAVAWFSYRSGINKGERRGSERTRAVLIRTDEAAKAVVKKVTEHRRKAVERSLELVHAEVDALRKSPLSNDDLDRINERLGKLRNEVDRALPQSRTPSKPGHGS